MTPQVVMAGGQQPADADGKGCERDQDGQPVAAGVDGSPPSKVAVDWAARDAQLRNLPLTLVHAVPNAATMILFRLLGELPYDRAHRIIDDAADVVSESTSQGNPVTLNTIMMFADPLGAIVNTCGLG